MRKLLYSDLVWQEKLIRVAQNVQTLVAYATDKDYARALNKALNDRELDLILALAYVIYDKDQSFTKVREAYNNIVGVIGRSREV